MSPLTNVVWRDKHEEFEEVVHSTDMISIPKELWDEYRRHREAMERCEREIWKIGGADAR